MLPISAGSIAFWTSPRRRYLEHWRCRTRAHCVPMRSSFSKGVECWQLLNSSRVPASTHRKTISFGSFLTDLTDTHRSTAVPNDGSFFFSIFYRILLGCCATAWEPGDISLEHSSRYISVLCSQTSRRNRHGRLLWGWKADWVAFFCSSHSLFFTLTDTQTFYFG